VLFVIAILFLLGGSIAVTSNSDTFSPAKFFVAFYLLFHVGAYFDPPSQEALILASLPLVLSVVFVFYEATRVQYLPSAASLVPKPLSDRGSYVVPLVIWGLSLPSLIAQMVMIDEFGGISGYVASINTRVVDWSGLGWARVLIGMLTAVNVAFFAIGVSRRRSTTWWALYGAHFLMVLAFGLLSGSRSGTLNVVALLIFSLHYIRRPVAMPTAAGAGVALIGLASLLGVARNGFRLEDGEFTTGFQNSTEAFSFNSFSYGVEPLKIITDTYSLILAHGSTFASLLTNAIPRSIYPDKPDTGGVFFTKNYVGDAWEGYSNLTPTFLGEWIINFGYLAGIIGFFISLGVIMLLLERAYCRLLRDPRRHRDEVFAVDVVIYLHVLWSAVGLVVGEVTNVVLGLVLNSLLPLFVIRLWMVARSRDAALTARPRGSPARALL
jgi:hypothetical protein